MDNEKKLLTDDEVETLDDETLKTVAGGQLILRRTTDYPTRCYVITCPKCGSGEVMMQNRYKSGDYTHYYVNYSTEEEIDGALDLKKSTFVSAIINIKFRCTACGYVATGFNHMKFTDDSWYKYHD